MNYENDEVFSPEDPRSEANRFDASSDPGNQKKSGCGMKFILILLASLGGITLLCCCGIGFSLYSMKPVIENDPVLAKQNLSQIIKVDLPDGFEPKNTFTMQIFSMISMNGVYIEDPKSGAIILLEFSGTLSENKDLQNKISEGVGTGQSSEELNVLEQKTRELTINGQTVKFNFIKGKDKKSGKEIRQILGIFPGKKGPVMLIMNVSEEKWNEEQTLKMLKSIKIPD